MKGIYFWYKKIQKDLKRCLFTYLVKKQCQKYGKNLKVNYKSSVSGNTIIKNNVNFNGMTICGRGRVIIGDYFHSGIDCLILSENHNYDRGNAIPYDGMSFVCKDVMIGDFVWLGSRVTILPGVKIGEGAIIQAGAVVSSDIAPYAIAGGNPAKVFKYRDVKHFKQLKKEKKFW